MQIKMIHIKFRSHYRQLDPDEIDPDQVDADQIYVAATWTQ